MVATICHLCGRGKKVQSDRLAEHFRRVHKASAEALQALRDAHAEFVWESLSLRWVDIDKLERKTAEGQSVQLALQEMGYKIFHGGDGKFLLIILLIIIRHVCLRVRIICEFSVYLSVKSEKFVFV